MKKENSNSLISKIGNELYEKSITETNSNYNIDLKN